MCIICIDFEKGKLSPFEAFRNLGEMSEKIGEKHTEEVIQLIINQDSEEFCESCEPGECDCH